MEHLHLAELTKVSLHKILHDDILIDWKMVGFITMTTGKMPAMRLETSGDPQGWFDDGGGHIGYILLPIHSSVQ